MCWFNPKDSIFYHRWNIHRGCENLWSGGGKLPPPTIGTGGKTHKITPSVPSPYQSWDQTYALGHLYLCYECKHPCVLVNRQRICLLGVNFIVLCTLCGTVKWDSEWVITRNTRWYCAEWISPPEGSLVRQRLMLPALFYLINFR